MSLQYEVVNPDSPKPEPTPAPITPEQRDSLIDLIDTAFTNPQYTRAIYDQLNREYDKRITPKFGHITKAKGQLPPYWNEEHNRPEELPLYQHNVCTGRFNHAMSQISLTYNAFFPNESYSKSLLDVKIVKNPFAPAPKDDGEDNRPKKDQAYIPKSADQKSVQDSNSYLTDLSDLIEQAYDNLIKNECWTKAEHLKMVSDMQHYGGGIYFYEDPDSYHYKALDFRKCRFPSGTTINVEEWEYVFIEHEMTVNDLVSKYKAAKPDSKSGWDKVALSELLSHIISGGRSVSTQSATHPIDRVKSIDNVREGFTGIDYGKICPASIPVVSCYWKEESGDISVATFTALNAGVGTDRFLYQKDNIADSFCEIFSFFPADETENEIRMIRGWGERIHPLCHAYDRSFCKFLDHLDFSATLFLGMDPNDLHKKILHFGSINVGKIDSVQNFPSALQPIIAGLALIDSKIDSITFTRGLNKTETMGEGRGAELASIVLTVEGRIHKHLNSRFAEHYTTHYKRNLAKIIRISVKKKNTSAIYYPAVKARFTDYLNYYNVSMKELQVDDNSKLNYGLPSNWIVVARKPDSSGIGNSPSYTVELLRPFFSSLPEAGFRYMLARIIADAFGDEDMIQKLLPDSDIAKATSEADTQLAETQAAIFTSQTSAFDQDLTPENMADPKLTDAHKFITLPASRENDHIVFLQVFLGKVDDCVQRMNRGEIERPTLHIWLYNLVSSAQAHMQLLRQDAVRGNRPEAQQLFKRFGTAFNMLRQVESQANSERQKKFDAVQKQIGQQKADSPQMITAQAKLTEARAKAADVQLKYKASNLDQFLQVQENRRSEESHIMNQGLIQAQKAATYADINGELNQGSDQVSQGGPGRPDSNFQGTGS